MADLSSQLLLALITCHLFVSAVSGQSDATTNDKHGIGTTNWNDVIDSLISQFRQQIFEQGKDMVRLPPIREKFSKALNGKFDASGGELRSVTSVHRVGNVTLDSSADPPLLTAQLRFGTVHIHYEHFYARVLGVGPRGKIDATVNFNKFLIRMRVLASDTTCRLDFEGVEMLELSGFKVKIKGLGLLNKLASFIARKLTEKMRVDIAKSLEVMIGAELRSMLRQAILDCTPFDSAGIDIRTGQS